jgi:hypothetical protein
LLRAHLERLGVSTSWLPSALDAIRHCEQGEYFQPIFSVAGPAPARSVVALMRLEPFVQGEIDWSISPSESPFWVGAVGDLQDELFDTTAPRFPELFWSEQNPGARPELEDALRVMVRSVEEKFVDATGSRLKDDARQGLMALGSAGYVWRVAESATQTTDLNLRADLANEVEAVLESFPRDAPDTRLLAWAATECVRRNLLFGSGSPGGWAAGGEFLRRGFRFAVRHVLRVDVAIPRRDRWYAFSYGVALFDVDEVLARRPREPRSSLQAPEVLRAGSSRVIPR